MGKIDGTLPSARIFCGPRTNGLRWRNSNDRIFEYHFQHFFYEFIFFHTHGLFNTVH